MDIAASRVIRRRARSTRITATVSTTASRRASIMLATEVRMRSSWVSTISKVRSGNSLSIRGRAR
nr:hypothetical protein [Thermosulfurimonas sp. F29]